MVNIDKLTFAFHKWTKKRWDSVRLDKLMGNAYQITFVGKITWSILNEYGEEAFAAVMNHEFLHMIIDEFVSKRACAGYDKYLGSCGLYTWEKSLELMV